MPPYRSSQKSPAKRARALKEAEETLVRPAAADGPTYVQLKPQEVHTRHELFQPREFLFAKSGLDTRHVTKLKRVIEIKGEIEPILVVKLGAQWVCVDGHHRVAAYQKLKCKEIKGEWFAGSLREAVDESYKRNEIAKLEIAREDKYEEAWRRVLLGGGSKAQISKFCGVGGTLVAFMRRVKRRWEKGSDDFAKQFRSRLSGRLDEASWSTARMIWLNTESKDTERDLAVKLARNMKTRLTDTLSRDPATTADALALYDRELPGPLMVALAERLDPKLPGPLMAALAEAVAKAQEAAEVDGESLHPGETPSDRTWREWAEDAREREEDGAAEGG
jgi:hypothetical protein